MSTSILITDVIQRERLRDAARRSIVPVLNPVTMPLAERVVRAVIGRLGRQVPNTMTDRTVHPITCRNGAATN